MPAHQGGKRRQVPNTVERAEVGDDPVERTVETQRVEVRLEIFEATGHGCRQLLQPVA